VPPDTRRDGPSTARRLPPDEVDLNADLGEGVTDDEGLLAVVTSANVACGYHAGDADTMRRVCAEAARRGASVGAQVSYADREGFGRVELDVAPDVLRDQVADQVGTLAALADAEGATVRYLKPHGALYHRCARDEVQASAVLEASGALPVLGMPGSVLLRLAGEAGRVVWHEGFPDRGYTEDGTGLLPRSAPGALVEGADEVAARAVSLAKGRLPAGAAERPAGVDSVCVHGDSPGAVAHAHAVRRALEAAGFTLRGL
jgi:UPF0271 protein